MSTVLRYTGNFTPPTSQFIYDLSTKYLSAIGGFTNVGSSGQSLASSPRQMTWNIQAVSPETGMITTINQGYFQLATTPIYDDIDANFETPAVGMYNMSFAGRDSSNNPVFVFGYRNDNPQLASIKITKLDVNTGAIQFGPTYDFSSGAAFEGQVYNFNQTGITVVSDHEQQGLGLSSGTVTGSIKIVGVSGNPAQHNPGSGFSLIATTLNRDTLSLGSYSVEYIKGNTVARRLTSTNPSAWIGPSEVSVPNQDQRYSTAQAAGNYANVVVRSSASGAFTVTDYRISAQLQSLGLFNAGTTNYFVNTGFTATTGSYQGGPVALIIWGINANQQVGANVLGGQMNPPSAYYSGSRMRSCVMSNTLNDGRWLMTGRQLNPGFGMSLYLQSARFVPSTITLGTTVTDTDMNIGAYAIVRGVSKNRAWLLYTQRLASQPFATDTNFSRGLWYRSIDITDNQVITLGSPVQITDPAAGNIYGMDMTAASTSIGAWTYIEAVIPQSGVPSNTLKPFMVGLRIPN
jgi:hypothetical protein